MSGYLVSNPFVILTGDLSYHNDFLIIQSSKLLQKTEWTKVSFQIHQNKTSASCSCKIFRGLLRLVAVEWSGIFSQQGKRSQHSLHSAPSERQDFRQLNSGSVSLHGMYRKTREFLLALTILWGWNEVAGINIFSENLNKKRKLDTWNLYNFVNQSLQ